ncbi:M15 family peptidase [Nocardioides guangzhouensis]|uniref:M15 family peptidase n=2 Tax=Nocardioides guangzhouensis TaxID=2497878 RepID=A0A4Q4ZMT7_9ACTN|nr:M15 family peptidase [Nocardioides guangzhouensis]
MGIGALGTPARGPAGRRPRRALVAAGALVPLLLLAACGDGAGAEPDADPSSPATASRSGDPQPGATVADPDHAVDPPGKLDGRLYPADMLVSSRRPLSDDVVQRIRGLRGVAAVERLDVAQVSVENRALTVAAVDPASYRRFNVAATAQHEDIWARVAGGELSIPQKLGRRLQQKGAYVQLGNDKTAPKVHIGSYAEQVPGIDVVVNKRWGEDLGMVEGNGLLVSTGIRSPQSVRGRVQEIIGGEPSIQLLDAVTRYGLDPDAAQTAIPTGGSVARAIGSFSYRLAGGNRISPDPSWVAANIRTEQVPILGAVTCHKVMLPQLRAALTDVVDAGLADRIHPGEFAGCYYPRFIAGTTSLSNHAFGIALDLNVPGNQRGTVGEMDRTVVAIFKRWGFAWGGDWRWTDPMHFEMNALVEVG